MWGVRTSCTRCGWMRTPISLTKSTSAVVMPKRVTALRTRQSVPWPRQDQNALFCCRAVAVIEAGQRRLCALMAPVVVFCTKCDSARAYALRLETDRRALMRHGLSSVRLCRLDGILHSMTPARRPRGATRSVDLSTHGFGDCWLASLQVWPEGSSSGPNRRGGGNRCRQQRASRFRNDTAVMAARSRVIASPGTR